MIHKKNNRLNVLEELRVLKKTVGILALNGYSLNHNTIKHLINEIKERMEWLKHLKQMKGGKS
jgi:hypothetical protein